MLSDMGGITGVILLLSLVCLIKANNSPTITTFVYNVCEDLKIGDLAFNIEATDDEGDPLNYELSGSNAPYFDVNAATGAVTVKIPLDRESMNVMPLRVTVSDGSSAISGDLNIILMDANDNRPIFAEASYDIPVPENTAVGSSLFKVSANDADTGAAGVVTYSIKVVTPSNGDGFFTIVSTTGEVKLNRELNYNTLGTFYRLQITATDGGGGCSKTPTSLSSNIFSIITVVDVPDLDPQFLGTPYTGSVLEHEDVGHSVLQVSAFDPDTGVSDVMIYTIEESKDSGLFDISSSTGIISVKAEIDREVVGDTVTLTVKATETNNNIDGVKASTTTTFDISIQDINDHIPEFYNCAETCVVASQFTGEVLEHSLGSISFDMTVRDLDRNSRTQLILEGVDKDVFSVEPSFTTVDTVVQLLVRQTEKLDYEKVQQMILNVVAVDEENTASRSTATVTINIRDANDNSPTFPEDSYKLSVPEHSLANTVLETITAEDPDTMDEGKITYRLLPENILQYFDVEANTGKIYVKSSVLLDRELRSLYTATLQALDSEGKPGTTVLEITLTDINDKTPVMNRESYLEFVEEGKDVQVKIEATDGDEPDTVNSKIEYFMNPSTYSSSFTIDRDTGILSNSKVLDREALDPELNGRILLTVVATDQGDPQLSSSVPVTISVEDVNDNQPKFKSPSYKFSVKEGQKGALVGSVYAEDLDQSSNFNRISFRIIDGGFGSFIVQSSPDTEGYRGDISVDPDIELDYESSRKRFSLKVEALDLGNEKDEVVVEVNVVDVNDERPEFDPIVPLNVKENTTITEPVGKFTAQDKDGNHSLVYELESVSCRCNGSWDTCRFFTLNPAGEVRLNPDYVLDFEVCDQALVEAQVVDKYTEKGENNSATLGQMVINIEDINDNAPEFIYSDTVYVVVAETASTGTSVARVTASDRDSGSNREIDFEVTLVQFENNKNETSDRKLLFEAVTTQQQDTFIGIIQSTESLDMTVQGRYVVTVRATDKGGLYTDTVLKIFNIDENFKVELEFGISEVEVQNKLFQITRALERATDAFVKIVAIRSEIVSESRNIEKTVIVAYFVYSNGVPLSTSDVDKGLADPEHFEELKALGLNTITEVTETEDPGDPVKFVLLGIVGGLALVMIVLTTSLLCTRRNYRRKLKAAEAMKSTVNADNQKGGPVVPGTNKYTMEGANPVLNLHYETAISLDLDEESSDVDKVSLNSLDNSDFINIDSGSVSMKEKKGGDDSSEDGEAFDALAQLGKNKSANKSDVGFINPVFDTTDL
ncbi:Cadherin-related family member 2 [Oryzias melastigma]|uniref:Cadherin-related family member 2 n=1 Tax=Oryzias melastigma TaxID=30732 RepID=A0A834FE60_ORYME|nr:Cadherin-related family member 2 [Oryzias melastigma]